MKIEYVFTTTTGESLWAFEGLRAELIFAWFGLVGWLNECNLVDGLTCVSLSEKEEKKGIGRRSLFFRCARARLGCGHLDADCVLACLFARETSWKVEILWFYLLACLLFGLSGLGKRCSIKRLMIHTYNPHTPVPHSKKSINQAYLPILTYLGYEDIRIAY